jgi:hypothetical protein
MFNTFIFLCLLVFVSADFRSDYSAFQSKHGDIDRLDPIRVARFLVEVGGFTGEEAAMFAEAGVDGAVLRKLDRDLLEEVGIKSKIQQTKFILFAEKIDAQEVYEEPIEKQSFR